MAYLAQPTTKTDYGVVGVGSFIDVLNGFISLQQDVSPSGIVSFNQVSIGGSSVVTSVNPVAGAGIKITNLVSIGNTVGFAVSNTGVLSVSTGAGISVGSSTGNITVSNTGVLSVNPVAGVGVSITSLVSAGNTVGFAVSNTGVLSVTAGAGISVSNSTGSITISSAGADLISTIGVTGAYVATANDEYIGVYSESNVIITLPAGITGRVYTIKDEYGQGSGKITIKPFGIEKIDNALTYVISVPNQSVSIVFRGTQWRVI